ncbi:MAG: hypothetical protein AB8G22_27925, partial [Saprospiraceae bacterium]
VIFPIYCVKKYFRRRTPETSVGTSYAKIFCLRNSSEQALPIEKITIVKSVAYINRSTYQ